MHEPLISVIIPVYRVEKYLGRCIDSILGQTYKNLEIILVDDGSDDRSGEICDEYAEKDARIIVIHKENGGLSDARNAGMKKATGEYIAFADSDDYFHKDMYQMMMAELMKENADVSICGYEYVYEGKDDDYGEVPEKYEKIIMDGREAQYRYYECDLTLPLTVAWNKIYKKTLLDGIEYPKGKIYEDEYTTFRILYKTKKIVFMNIPFCRYFQRDDSIIGSKLTEKNMQVFGGYISRISFFAEHEEQRLWEMEVKHTEHMLCYQQQKYALANIHVDVFANPYTKQFRKQIRKDRVLRKRTPFKTQVELNLFVTIPKLYYSVWKMIKKVRG